MTTLRTPPTVDIAIDECKRYGVEFSWEWSSKHHVKFYITGYSKVIIMSQGNKSNVNRTAGKIRLDIKKAVREMGRRI